VKEEAPAGNGTLDGKRILVIEDDPSISLGLRMNLEAEGYSVQVADDGEAGLECARHKDVDLIVLDIMLPKLNGFELLRLLRAEDQITPVIVLSARDTELDVVMGLEFGAEDYVTKPFSLAELVARAQAILRRTAGALPGDVLRFHDLRLDESRHEVFRGDTRLDLTATEFNLLRFFMLNPRRVLSKHQILRNVWRYDFGGNGNVVETYVSYLRRKLQAVGPPLIRTVRQAGYMLEADEA
jgi:two-component system, OmpR family, response regulator